MDTDITFRITLNGDPRRIAPGSTVDALVRDLGLRPEVVAVELNERLVNRSQRASTLVREGDRVEVVTLVGGG